MLYLCKITAKVCIWNLEGFTPVLWPRQTGQSGCSFIYIYIYDYRYRAEILISVGLSQAAGSNQVGVG